MYKPFKEMTSPGLVAQGTAAPAFLAAPGVNATLLGGNGVTFDIDVASVGAGGSSTLYEISIKQITSISGGKITILTG
jgi:hypothetical protein